MSGDLAPPASLSALTLHQPWASAMALGLKAVETRDWGSAPSVGRWLAIHAGKRVDEAEEAAVFEAVEARARRLDQDAWGERLAAWRRLREGAGLAMPRGAVVAVGRLARLEATTRLRPGPVEAALGNYGLGRVGWCFASIVALDEPIAASGKQGLWRWTPDDPAVLPRCCWAPPLAAGPPPAARPQQGALFDFGAGGAQPRGKR